MVIYMCMYMYMHVIQYIHVDSPNPTSKEILSYLYAGEDTSDANIRHQMHHSMCIHVYVS